MSGAMALTAFHVSLNDTKGTWFDHAAGAGGGLLDLV